MKPNLSLSHAINFFFISVVLFVIGGFIYASLSSKNESIPQMEKLPKSKDQQEQNLLETVNETNAVSNKAGKSNVVDPIENTNHKSPAKVDNSKSEGKEDQEEEEEEDEKEEEDLSVNFKNNQNFYSVLSENEDEIETVNDDGGKADNDNLNSTSADIHKTIEIPADIPEQVTILTNSKLFQLIESNKIKTFNSAIKNVNNIDQIWDENGYNLLHRAAAKYSTKIIDSILTKCPNGFANEKTRNDHKLTAVHLVIENSKDKSIENISEVLNILIQNSADVNAISETGYSPLYSAIIHNNLKAMESLLNHGANVNVSFQGLPLLHHSFNYYGIEGTDLLLKHNADCLVLNKNNRAALHEAVFMGRENLVNLLIDNYKCDVNIRTNAKSNPQTLHKKVLRSAEILYDATPLHYAAKMGEAMIAARLIKNGANEKARDSYGKTPWFYDKAGIHSKVQLIKN
jgi:hypothetical protein